MRKQKQYLGAQFYLDPINENELKRLSPKDLIKSGLTRVAITGSLNKKNTLALAVIIEKFMRKLEKQSGTIVTPIEIKTLRNKI